jgi:nicotinate-nucleotide adenylyltransferase
LVKRKRTIGLLGGSFNPAHAGHVYISMHALTKLKLDEVWWLVSPHNPLKAKDSLADYQERLKGSRAITRKTPIKISDLEAQKGFHYTYQTMRYLKKRYPRVQFVWLMGADNLAGFHRWQHFLWLLNKIPMVIFDRAPYSHASLKSLTYLRMRPFLLRNKDINGNWRAPGLHFVHLKRDPHSSTDIRKHLENAGN